MDSDVAKMYLVIRGNYYPMRHGEHGIPRIDNVYGIPLSVFRAGGIVKRYFGRIRIIGSNGFGGFDYEDYYGSILFSKYGNEWKVEWSGCDILCAGSWKVIKRLWVTKEMQ